MRAQPSRQGPDATETPYDTRVSGDVDYVGGDAVPSLDYVFGRGDGRQASAGDRRGDRAKKEIPSETKPKGKPQAP
jgi:hypothetical protein